ncbi:MAG: BsuBI/PstI family type II restriction endonuclease [bacterium]|nr:BsuBI/PstI family type II restriction endonuclease [bacterium]
MPSKHNKLESAIVEEFTPRFIPNAKPLFLRGAGKKPFLLDETSFGKLGVSVSEHRNFPDVILYDSKKKWLFLIEAVAVKDLISPKRRFELENLFKKCKCGKVYITAFWNFATYTKHIDDIAWETEVWIAEMPSHMIHLNGDKFLGPR